MTIPTFVLRVYAALGIMLCAFAFGFHKKNFKYFMVFTILTTLGLNIGYFINGVPNSMASFVGLFDPLDNLGTENDPEGTHKGLVPCRDGNNSCSVWDEDVYPLHPSWAVALYDRFASGSQTRRNVLYAHIFFNTLAFVLMNVQFLSDELGKRLRYHKYTGRLAFVSLTIGSCMALWMGSEHSDVPEYGGMAVVFGWFWMVTLMWGSAAIGVYKAYIKDFEGHRTWMIRALGATWGAFWLYRIMLLVLGPIFRNHEPLVFQFPTWLSVPGGILIAELLFRYIGKKPLIKRD